MNIKKCLLKWLFGDNDWAAAVIPKTYRDKDEIIRRVLFEALVRYVEDEDNLAEGRCVDYYSVELQCNFVTLDEVNKRIAWRQDLYDAYLYIKETRDKLEADLDWNISITRVEELDQKTLETIVKYHHHLWT